MLALSLAIPSHAAQPSTFPASAVPATEAAIANWRAKRFGMFIHWGPVSLTGKDKTLYLHILKHGGGVFRLPALPAKIVSAKLLTGGEAKANQTDKELSLTLSPTDPKEIDVIVKLELDQTAMDIAPIETSKNP